MTLRVIAGSARGAVLVAPGAGTRPTSARLREALFAMLEAAGVSMDETWDLYAGSGALGIEALSRGAGHVTFVESARPALRALRENLRRVTARDATIAARATVVPATVGRWRPPPDRPATVVLADPPYDDDEAWEDIARATGETLTPGAVVVVEHAARRAPPSTLGGRALVRERRHGDGALAWYAAAGTPGA